MGVTVRELANAVLDLPVWLAILLVFPTVFLASIGSAIANDLARKMPRPPLSRPENERG